MFGHSPPNQVLIDGLPIWEPINRALYSKITSSILAITWSWSEEFYYGLFRTRSNFWELPSEMILRKLT